jgi:hypothetical protein
MEQAWLPQQQDYRCRRTIGCPGAAEALAAAQLSGKEITWTAVTLFLTATRPL